ncbi:MAG: 2-amino-4-hydroxy-6-hydroxymethyldihydropteridine diphosphokinase [Planctomycetota bacterium]
MRFCRRSLDDYSVETVISSRGRLAAQERIGKGDMLASACHNHGYAALPPLPDLPKSHRFMPTQCLISLGSNLGDRHAIMADAAAAISQANVDGVPLVGQCESIEFSPDSGSVATVVRNERRIGLRTSRLYQTPAIGGPGGQSPFLNAVAAFATDIPASAVLDILQAIESDLGRQRRVRWGARVIDLDVVLHGRLEGQSTAGRRGLIGGRGPAGSSRALVVPHPRYTARKFVLTPACDVAADFCDPRFGWTIGELNQHLDADVPSVALTGGDEAIRMQLCHQLADRHQITILPESARGIAPPDLRTAYVSPVVPACLRDSPVPVADESRPPRLPRLIVRIQRTTPADRWPAPHQIWPCGWRWPEYRLEVDDLAWAVDEIASALDSMRCDLTAVTNDGAWW